MDSLAKALENVDRRIVAAEWIAANWRDMIETHPEKHDTAEARIFLAALESDVASHLSTRDLILNMIAERD